MMSILQISGHGAVLILFIVIVRALAIDRLPKGTFVLLWGIAAVRLILPVALPSQLSIYNLTGRAQEAASAAQLVAETTVQSGQGALVSSAGGADGSVLDAVRTASLSSGHVLSAIWTIGLVLTAVAAIVPHVRQRRIYRESLPVQDNGLCAAMARTMTRRTVSIRYTELVGTPLTYGVLRPVILLPKSLAAEDGKPLKFVLAHELTHIRRFDVCKKAALVFVACIHWFNPLVWVMLALANRDIELACDEHVLQKFGRNSRKDYAQTLIRLEEARHTPSPLMSGFSKHATRERIISIMNYKKISVFSTALAVLLITGTVAVFATTAVPNAYEERDEPALTLEEELLDSLDFIEQLELTEFGVTVDREDQAVYYNSERVAVYADNQTKYTFNGTWIGLADQGVIIRPVRDGNKNIVDVEIIPEEEIASGEAGFTRASGDENPDAYDAYEGPADTE